MEEVEEKKTVIEPRGEELEEIGSLVAELDRMMGEGGEEMKKEGEGKKDTEKILFSLRRNQ